MIVDAPVDNVEASAVDSEADLTCRRRLQFWVVQGVHFRDKQLHQALEKRRLRHMVVIDASIPDEAQLVRMRDEQSM